MGIPIEIEKKIKKINEAFAENKDFPDGAHAGKLFSISVADGSAVYEIVNIERSANMVEIKWREDLCLDEYQSILLGNGGMFPLDKIENVISQEDILKKIFNRKEER